MLKKQIREIDKKIQGQNKKDFTSPAGDYTAPEGGIQWWNLHLNPKP
jgi:hypothetical protein